jgi:heme/copper-type cytochrome/quinol oxidase subunit 4
MELTKQQPGGAASYTDKLSKYLIVYVCILALAGLQFVLAYQHVDVSTMIFRMFAVAFLEAGLAIVFFMHMGSENRTFVTWVAIVTLLVFAALQYSWTDSYRMERDAPQSFKNGPPQ